MMKLQTCFSSLCLLVLFGGSPLGGRGFYLLAVESGAACVQTYVTAPAWLDPNEIAGILLPPVSGDPNTWEIACGKYVRLGTYCDGEGYAVGIESKTPEWTVTQDPNTATWKLAGDVRAGPNIIKLVATDKPPSPHIQPAMQEFTVGLWGIPPDNEKPVVN